MDQQLNDVHYIEAKKQDGLYSQTCNTEGDAMNEYIAPEKKNRIITIPNILSVCRIVMIPVFIWVYCFRGEYHLAFLILCLSGITDLADGFIARTFHMVSNLGKALDPIADKLTQGAVLLCLGIRFPQMFFLAGLLAAKEITTGLMSLSAIHRTNEVKSADWHGKITTCLLYFTMLLHILWGSIPQTASILLTVLCVIVMTVSFVMYFRRNIALLRGGKLSGDRGHS